MSEPATSLPVFDKKYSLATNNQPYTYTDNPRYTRYRGKFDKVKYNRFKPVAETSFSEVSQTAHDHIVDVPEEEPLLQTGEVAGGTSSVITDSISGVVGSLGGAISGAAETVGTTGTVVTGVAAATGIGLIGHTLYSGGSSDNKSPKTGYVLPFSKNIGPGNDIQPPQSAADAIAREHDLLYGSAKKASDILAADKKSISEFQYETIYGDNPISQLQAGAGSVGLSIKHAIEKATGKVIYGNYVL